MPYLLFLKKRQNLKLSSVANNIDCALRLYAYYTRLITTVTARAHADIDLSSSVQYGIEIIENISFMYFKS